MKRLMALALIALSAGAQTVIQQNFDVRSYNFTRTNGSGASGNLSTAGAGKTVTLAPCPAGINANAVNIVSVRLVDATNSESVLITSYVAGTNNCTIGFTTTMTFTGAYQVKSATSGVDEAANNASAVGGVVYVAEGSYPMYTEAHLRGSLTLQCASAGTILLAQNATQNLIVATTSTDTQRVRINNCSFSTSVTKTAGAAIQINGSGAVSNYGTIIDGVTIQGHYTGIHFASATHWSVINPLILAGGNTDILIENTIAPDSGDSSIVGGVIDNSNPNAGTAIRYDSAGGLKISNLKILNHAYIIDLTVGNGVATSDFAITNSSFENFTATGISLGGTGQFYSVHMSNIQMAGIAGSTCIASYAALNTVTVTGSLLGGCSNGVSIQNARAIVQGNYISTPTGIITDTGASNVLIANNQMIGNTTPYTFNVAPKLIDHWTGIPFASLPSVANGSIVYCSDCDATCSAGNSTGRTCVRENGTWTH